MNSAVRSKLVHRLLFSTVLAANVGILLFSAWSVVRAETMATAPQQDRQAILAMAGEHRVTFDFRETASLKSGYTVAEPYTEDATETVFVIEDQPNRIMLQHILVLGAPGREMVIKHWRQDWRYEPEATFQYVGPDDKGNPLWHRRELSAQERKGKWVQEVYQVDDAPRYASLGEWKHLTPESVVGSVWEGEATRRPLPRREYTTRNDYTVMTAVNRHMITLTGWVHEQENLKQISTPEGTITSTLARELGNNSYDRFPSDVPAKEKVDFSRGYKYWSVSAPFWADVRQAWSQRLFGQPALRVATKLDGKPLNDHFAAYAKQIQSSGNYDSAVGRKFIDEQLSQYAITGTATGALARPEPQAANPQ